MVSGGWGKVGTAVLLCPVQQHRGRGGDDRGADHDDRDLPAAVGATSELPFKGSAKIVLWLWPSKRPGRVQSCTQNGGTCALPQISAGYKL